MLILSRRKGESITIGKDVTVTILDNGSSIRLGITAPKNVAVHRSELADVIGRDHSLSKVNGERREEFRARDKSG